jgi:uncharacterized protein YjbI with pentapeptide repeats
MSEQLKKYLDSVFSSYEDSPVARELKEELFHDFQEKLSDLKDQGYEDEAAYRMTIDSIGDISEIIESIITKKKELKQMIGMDYSKTNIPNSDLKGVKVPDGKFNYSNLKGSDFSNSDLTGISLKGTDLRNVNFDGANLTGAKINKASMTGASFQNCVLDQTEFIYSDLSGVSFDHQTLNGTSFDYSGLKGTSFKNAILKNVNFRFAYKVDKAVFDGATMDKLTYTVLKSLKANLTNVTVI